MDASLSWAGDTWRESKIGVYTEIFVDNTGSNISAGGKWFADESRLAAIRIQVASGVDLEDAIDNEGYINVVARTAGKMADGVGQVIEDPSAVAESLKARGEQRMMQVLRADRGDALAYFHAAAGAFADVTGGTGGMEGFTGKDAITGRELTASERAERFTELAIAVTALKSSKIIGAADRVATRAVAATARATGRALNRIAPRISASASSTMTFGSLNPMGGNLKLTFSFGPKPFVPSGLPAKITGYSRHGLMQAIGREGVGVSPRAILDAFKNPKRILYREFNDTFLYHGELANVVINRQGKVVTTYSKGSLGHRGVKP